VLHGWYRDVGHLAHIAEMHLIGDVGKNTSEGDEDERNDSARLEDHLCQVDIFAERSKMVKEEEKREGGVDCAFECL